MGIFIDTSFFLGLIHPKDVNHSRSVELLKEMSRGKFGLIYTSSFIIAETATIILIRTKNNGELLQDFYDLIYGPDQFIRMIPWSHTLEKNTWQIFQAHNIKAKTKKEYLSFIDASNISYCRNFKIEQIIGFDGDFDPYLLRIV